MLKIGVVGVGHLGKIHLRLLKEIDLFEIVGVFDTNEDRMRVAETAFNLRHYSSFDELLEAADVIDIVTPAVSHHNYAAQALRKSKHIFIEKPVTCSTEEAKDIVALASEAHVKVQVGHVERFNPAFIAAQPFIRHPLFIEVHRLSTPGVRGRDVSVVHDLMIHDIDIILSMVKSPVKKVWANGVSIISDTVDLVNARIEFDNSCVANLTASRIALSNRRVARFFQKDAYITIDFLEKKTSVIKLLHSPNNSELPSFIDELEQRQSSKFLNFTEPVIIPNNAIQTELKFFGEAILKDTATPVTIEDAYDAIKITNQIIEKFKPVSLMDN